MMEQSENSDSSSNEYEVEAIEKDRQKRQYDPHKRKWVFVTEYLIKWVGYKKRSWEPEENLDNCGQLLKNYKKNKSKINNNNTDTSNIYNKNNTIKNTNKTPVKFVTNKKNNINNNNKAKREKEKELTDKKINDDDMTYNNINSYKPIYSDEEENKYTPMSSMNLNHSFFTSDYLKLDNDSYTSFLKKNDIKKKSENINNNNLLSSSSDYDIDIDKYVSKVTNNDENNNNNNINNNDNNATDFSDILQKFQEKSEKSKEKEKSIKINLLQKKRKLIENYSEENSEHKENSDISISIDDPFIEMEKDSISFLNTNDNSNSNSNNINGNNNLRKGNLELLEIRIPENKNDQIDLVWRDKEKNIVFKCTSKNTVMVPQGIIIDYYEKILKEYLNRKIIKIN